MTTLDSNRNGSVALTPPLPLERWGAEELAATLDLVSAGIWAMDLEGRCVFVNQAACRIFGYSPEECLGRRLPRILNRNNPAGWNCPQVKCAIQEALESGSAAELDNEVFLHRDGTPLPVRCSLQPVFVQGRRTGAVITVADVTARKLAGEALRQRSEWLRLSESLGSWFDLDHKTCDARRSNVHVLLYRVDTDGVDPDGVYPGAKRTSQGVAHDITNRKLAEKALQESRQCFRSIVETIQDVFWIMDVDLRKTVYVSPAYERIWGRSVEEAYANPRAFVDAIHPDDREGVLAVFKLQQKGVPYEHEYRLIQPGGSIVWIWSRAFPIRDESGKVVLYTGVAQDITQRKQLELGLRIHCEKLARSNEELERFAYVAAHDLQEPLRMIASFTHLLSERYSGRLDETADRYINFAVDGAKRMQQSIADLLSYSRVNSKELKLSSVDCQAAVQEAVRSLQAAIEATNASVDWDPLPVLSVDQRQFTQLFQNLLGNGIKFTKKQQAPRIHISAEDSGAEWLFSVQDNGIGIEPRHAERVFQVFQRLHTKEEFPGTGIGLALCKTVVERHGGRIWMESEPGVGSTFRFTVPKKIYGN
jgi:PAS domain S-box-containing protein